MVAEVRVGVLSPMIPVNLVLPVVHHVLIAVRAKDIEAVVLRDLQLDLDALAIVAEVMAVSILLSIGVVDRQVALVVSAVRGLRHGRDSLGRLAQSLLLVLIELVEQ